MVQDLARSLHTRSNRSDPTATVSDFSSAAYWSKRFDTETSFEWLLPSDRLIPLIVEHLALVRRDEDASPSLQCLHFGCGTSDLGRRVQSALVSDVEVVDADYVAESIAADGVLPLDCLDETDIKAKSPKSGWDMILDKSTADAISCGGDEQLILLARNLACVTRIGVKWVSISYSSTRFHLPGLGETGWEVVERRFLESTSMPEGRRVKDDKTGQERIVFEPETGVWGWVLRRI